jgi:pimeloyl-ACP methyl ester carboxylesterase
LRAIIPSWRLTCAGWAFPPSPPEDSTRRRKLFDVAGVLDELKIGRVALATHDIGNMVGYAFAAQYPDRVTRFVLIDAPLPGVGPWEEIDSLLRDCAD